MNRLKNTLLGCVLLLTLVSCKSALTLNSGAVDQQIAIDGSEVEWLNDLQPIAEENFAIGILNDDENLYVSLVTADVRVRSKIMALGMTLWLDPSGGSEKSLGIRFPLGIIDAGLPFDPFTMLEQPEFVEQLFNESLTELEIVRERDEDTKRWLRSEIPGLELAASSKQGTLVYEMKIPLDNEELGYSLDAANVQQIGIGLETPRFQREEMERLREQPSASSQGGGYGQYGAGGSGFGGSQADVGGPIPTDRSLLEVTSPTKFWATFSLVAP
ncbi:MAG: hypothetical protein KTR29_01895 [Rhodothermaceae bacterium]|nr:hypothetical protein [Rhodothermaceae bacterium]